MFNKEQNSPLNVLSFSTRFGVGKKSMEEQVQEEVSYLNQVIQKKDGEPFDIQVKNACVKNKVLKKNIKTFFFSGSFKQRCVKQYM